MCILYLMRCVAIPQESLSLSISISLSLSLSFFGYKTEVLTATMCNEVFLGDEPY
jgi:hypothetical protein